MSFPTLPSARPHPIQRGPHFPELSFDPPTGSNHLPFFSIMLLPFCSMTSAILNLTPLGTTILHPFDFVSHSTEFFNDRNEKVLNSQ